MNEGTVTGPSCHRPTAKAPVGGVHPEISEPDSKRPSGRRYAQADEILTLWNRRSRSIVEWRHSMCTGLGLAYRYFVPGTSLASRHLGVPRQAGKSTAASVRFAPLAWSSPLPLPTIATGASITPSDNQQPHGLIGRPRGLRWRARVRWPSQLPRGRRCICER